MERQRLNDCVRKFEMAEEKLQVHLRFGLTRKSNSRGYVRRATPRLQILLDVGTELRHGEARAKARRYI